MSVVDKANINTNPGSPGAPFSPPANWHGDSSDFIDWVRDRYVLDQAFRVNVDAHVRFYQSHQSQVTIIGPFTAELKYIFGRIASLGCPKGQCTTNTVAISAA